MNLSDLLEIELNPFTIFIILFYVIVFLLLIREVRLWYWKVNERLGEQKKQTKLLEEILFQVSQINIKVDPDIEIVYEDETENEESTP